MAFIDIDGKRVEVPDDLSDDELDQVANEMATEPGLTRGQAIAEGFKQVAQQSLGNIVSGPMRLGRALGVGTEKLVEKAIPGGANPSFKEAAERTKAAFQPGFAPADGEKIGAALGSGLPALAAGPVGAAAIMAGSVGGEGLAEGKPVGEAAKDAALEGALNLGTHGVLKGGSMAANATFRNILARGKGLTREAVDAVLDSPIWESAPSLKTAGQELRNAVINAKNTAGKAVGRIRKNLGLPNTVTEVETRILSGESGVPSPQEALQGAVDAIKRGVSNQGKKQPASRLDDLLKAKENLRAVQKFSKGAADPKFRLTPTESVVYARKIDELNTLIDNVPGGKLLRRAQEKYSEVLSDFEEFATKLRTEGTTEQFLKSLVKKGDEVTGRLQDAADAINRIESKFKLSKFKNALRAASEDAFTSAKEPSVVGVGVETASGTLGNKAFSKLSKLGDRATKLPAKLKLASPLTRAILGDE